MKTMNKEKDLLVSVVGLLILGVALILLRLHSVGEPLTRDITFYAYSAHEILSGSELYTDIYSFRPPAIQATYALAELIWGYEPATVYYLGIVFSLISLVFIYLFLKIISGSKVAFVGSIFWVLSSHSITLESNQPNGETFINSFTLIALYCFAKYSTGDKKYLSLAGLFLALASLYKQLVLFPFLAIAIYLVLPMPTKEWDKWAKGSANKLIRYAGPAALVWIAVFLYFALLGRLPEFLNQLFGISSNYAGDIWLNLWTFFNTPHAVFAKSLKDIWILVLFSVAWVFTGKSSYGSLRKSFFVFLYLGVCVEIASPGRGYPHYYSLLIPIFCIMSALFVADIQERFEKKKDESFGWPAILICMVIVGHLSIYQWNYLKMSPLEISSLKYNSYYLDVQKVAAYVEKNTTSDDKVYEWGGEPGIYFYSKRNSSTKVFNTFEFVVRPYEHRIKAMNRAYKEIVNDPPALFIWNRGDWRFKKMNQIFYKYMIDNYKLAEKIGFYEIYSRKI